MGAGWTGNGKPNAANDPTVKEFNLYDILGVLAPGAVVTVGVMIIFPETIPVLTKENLSAGELGFVVLISYVIGSLVAALGNFLEGWYWRFRGGWPTDRAHQSHGKILEARELECLQEKLRSHRLKTATKFSALVLFALFGRPVIDCRPISGAMAARVQPVAQLFRCEILKYRINSSAKPEPSSSTADFQESNDCFRANLNVSRTSCFLDLKW